MATQLCRQLLWSLPSCGTMCLDQVPENLIGTPPAGHQGPLACRRWTLGDNQSTKFLHKPVEEANGRREAPALRWASSSLDAGPGDCSRNYRSRIARMFASRGSLASSFQITRSRAQMAN